MGREHGYITIDDALNVTAYRTVGELEPIPLGNGALPGWWVINSTPGAESVRFESGLTAADADTLFRVSNADEWLLLLESNGAFNLKLEPDEGAEFRINALVSPLTTRQVLAVTAEPSVLTVHNGDGNVMFAVSDDTGVPNVSVIGGPGQGSGDFSTLFKITNEDAVVTVELDSGGGAAFTLPEDGGPFRVSTTDVPADMISAYRSGGENRLSLLSAHAGDRLGFFSATPVPLQGGVPVTAAGIHSALVAYGLITA